MKTLPASVSVPQRMGLRLPAGSVGSIIVEVIVASSLEAGGTLPRGG